MAKLLQISILVATVLVPTLAARANDPRRGLKLAFAGMAAFVAAYWLLVMLGTPEA